MLDQDADFLLGSGNRVEVFYAQPAPQSQPVYNNNDEPSTFRNSYSSSPWLTDHRSIASRAASRASFVSRCSKAHRRPTISAPTDFKRVQSGRISPVRRTITFRPLQLSIYLPGNELPDLPNFWRYDGEENEVLERPAQALVKSRSEPLLLRNPPRSFSIPRKPVASRTSSLDASRFSIDSRMTLGDISMQPRSRSIDHMRSGSIESRPSFATTQSTRNFLEAFDTPLPSVSPAALRVNSGPELPYPIYRRASEQSLRLRTHLEERELLESKLPDCDTILEEKTPVSPESARRVPLLLPNSDCDDAAEAVRAGQSRETPECFKHNTHPEDQGPALSMARSSSGSSTLLNPPTAEPNLIHVDTEISIDGQNVIVPTTEDAQTSVGKRLSQWLLRAFPPIASTQSLPAARDRSSTLTSLNSLDAPNSPWTSPRSQHTKQSSMSSYWTHGRGASLDAEKGPTVVDVGVAF